MLNNLSVLGTVRLYFVCGGNLISRWDFPDIEKNLAAVCKKFRSMYIKSAAEKHSQQMKIQMGSGRKFMAESLKNTVTVLTGAGGGIGSAIAEKLSACGMKIVMLGGNNQAKLAATAEKIASGTECFILPGNLTDMDFLEHAVTEIIDRFGKIDVLINNAGIAQSQKFEQISEAEFDRIMAINNKVPFFQTQKVIPHLKKSGGTIVNIASVVAHAGYPLQSAYSASKHAMLGWTKSVASEYYKDNIRVHAIAPGGVYTDMVKISRPDLSSEGMIMPEDIAEIVWFLLAHRTNAVIDEILVHRVGKEPFLV